MSPIYYAIRNVSLNFGIAFESTKPVDIGHFMASLGHTARCVILSGLCIVYNLIITHTLSNWRYRLHGAKLSNVSWYVWWGFSAEDRSAGDRPACLISLGSKSRKATFLSAIFPRPLSDRSITIKVARSDRRLIVGWSASWSGLSNRSTR